MLFVPGQLYHRSKDIHAHFGGQAQGGISTPASYPFIFLFTSTKGSKYGYHDGWNGDRVFLYTGEGQTGDMKFVRGNKAIRFHVSEGKDLHLFEYVAKAYVRYIGQMIYVGHHLRQAPDASGANRTIIVFELIPLEMVSVDAETPSASETEGLNELREKALRNVSESVPIMERLGQYRQRSDAVRTYALKRAEGICEACGNQAPFNDRQGQPYLEVHHIRRLSDGGPDHPQYVAGLCPSCHRRVHYGQGGTTLNEQIRLKIKLKEAAFK